MITKSRYLQARLPNPEYTKLQFQADAAGLSISEHTRRLLARESDAVSTEEALRRIEDALARLSAPAAPTATDSDRLLLVEILLLVRELAADRNAQILFRVNQKLDSQFGAQRVRT